MEPYILKKEHSHSVNSSVSASQIFEGYSSTTSISTQGACVLMESNAVYRYCTPGNGLLYSIANKHNCLVQSTKHNVSFIRNTLNINSYHRHPPL